MSSALLILFCAFSIIGQSFAAPYSSNSTEEDDFMNDHYEDYIRYGDMILPKDFFNNPNRNAIPDKRNLWQNGRVPYVIDSSLSHATARINRAFQEYHSKTCVRFIPRTNERNYINIFAGSGCYSLVGDNHRGSQPLSLGQGCLPHGTIVHELGHAIGFHHEQNRSDRDNHLTIHWQNIQRGYESQFQKLQPSENWLITPFDTSSVMLYGETAFSKDGYSKTMTAKNGQKLYETYDKAGMSPSDAKRVNVLYSC